MIRVKFQRQKDECPEGFYYPHLYPRRGLAYLGVLAPLPNL
jgi:hypothetical protein